MSPRYSSQVIDALGRSVRQMSKSIHVALTPN